MSFTKRCKRLVSCSLGFLNYKPKLTSATQVPLVQSPYDFMIKKDNLLYQLGEKYKPTKRLHNYLPYYWLHFQDIRESVTSFCEIGVQAGKSLKMWEEFFPNATICGLDIDPKCKDSEGGRRKIIIGDQADPATLDKLLEAGGGHFDIVIDDGSHFVNHQLKSFDYLFPHLSSHGIYVVEDTGGIVNDGAMHTVRRLQDFIKHVYYWPVEKDAKEWTTFTELPVSASWADRHLIGLAFYPWQVFLFRGQNPEDNDYLKLLQKANDQ